MTPLSLYMPVCSGHRQLNSEEMKLTSSIKDKEMRTFSMNLRQELAELCTQCDRLHEDKCRVDEENSALTHKVSPHFLFSHSFFCL